MTFRRLKLNDSNVTKTIKRFRLKIKTKTKSKMPAKINTGNKLNGSDAFLLYSLYVFIWDPFFCSQ